MKIELLERLSSSGWRVFWSASLSVGLLGPILSFFTLQNQMHYSLSKAIAYSLVSFTADIVSILLFAFWLRRIGFAVPRAVGTATVVYIPLWIFDIFDIYQPLRFLSNLGLAFSIWFLLNLLNELPQKDRVLSSILFLFLYIADALSAEIIAHSPLLLRLVKLLTPS